MNLKMGNHNQVASVLYLLCLFALLICFVYLHCLFDELLFTIKSTDKEQFSA